jgi:hypothetical protein
LVALYLGQSLLQLKRLSLLLMPVSRPARLIEQHFLWVRDLLWLLLVIKGVRL